METRASTTTAQWNPSLTQYTPSASTAVMPETAIGHQWVFCAGAWRSRGVSVFCTSVSMPSDSMASTAGLIASGACRTVSVRCIRLNSRPCTPGMPCSLPRIRPSSVGQSIFAMRSTVVTACASWRSARMPMEASALSIAAVDGNVCWTPSTRCIRLKSIVITPGSLPSRSRISASSVGQSMFSMR